MHQRCPTGQDHPCLRYLIVLCPNRLTGMRLHRRLTERYGYRTAGRNVYSTAGIVQDDNNKRRFHYGHRVRQRFGSRRSRWNPVSYLNVKYHLKIFPYLNGGGDKHAIPIVRKRKYQLGDLRVHIWFRVLPILVTRVLLETTFIKS